MLALSGLREGFARGVVYLHAACAERSAFFAPRVLHRGRRARIPVPKILSAKSRVSTSSKLIEIKGLQPQYFGHLRKTGGRGSYGHLTRDVPPEPAEGLFSYSFVLFPARSLPSRGSLVRFRLNAHRYPLSVFLAPPSPIFPTLARPLLNPFVFLCLRGRGWGVVWSDQ